MNVDGRKSGSDVQLGEPLLQSQTSCKLVEEAFLRGKILRESFGRKGDARVEVENFGLANVVVALQHFAEPLQDVFCTWRQTVLLTDPEFALPESIFVNG